MSFIGSKNVDLISVHMTLPINVNMFLHMYIVDNFYKFLNLIHELLVNTEINEYLDRKHFPEAV